MSYKPSPLNLYILILVKLHHIMLTSIKFAKSKNLKDENGETQKNN